MGQTHRLSLAFLAGCAIIWLTSVAVALVAAAPGWRSVIMFARAQGIPLSLVSPVLMVHLPVLLVAVCVGVIIFRLGGGRLSLFLAAAAAPVLFGLYQSITLLWPINPLGVALQTPELWVGVAIVPAGLLLAMVLTKGKRNAA